MRLYRYTGTYGHRYRTVHCSVLWHTVYSYTRRFMLEVQSYSHSWIHIHTESSNEIGRCIVRLPPEWPESLELWNGIAVFGSSGAERAELTAPRLFRQQQIGSRRHISITLITSSNRGHILLMCEGIASVLYCAACWPHFVRRLFSAFRPLDSLFTLRIRLVRDSPHYLSHFSIGILNFRNQSTSFTRCELHLCDPHRLPSQYGRDGHWTSWQPAFWYAILEYLDFC